MKIIVTQKESMAVAASQGRQRFHQRSLLKSSKKATDSQPLFGEPTEDEGLWKTCAVYITLLSCVTLSAHGLSTRFHAGDP